MPACVDDGNPCNGDEFCGSCGSDVSFPCCQHTTPPAPLTPCGDDAIFCNGIKLCDDSQQCVNEDTLFQNPRCGSNGECGDFCDEANDICADPAGTPCKDDGVFCTDDTCNGVGPIGACVHTPNQISCDDGVNCTSNDVCSGGACAGTAVQCDDGISCTLDTCDEATGSCQSDNGQCECQTDADCDDNNLCTDEFCCTTGDCLKTPGQALTCIRSNNTNACDDGLFCDGPDTCEGGTCSLHDGDPCTTGAQCDQTCNEATDNCFDPTGTPCNDGDDLTFTECSGNGTCIVTGTLDSQGGKLGCSLNPTEDPSFTFGSLAWMMTGAAGILALGHARYKKSRIR